MHSLSRIAPALLQKRGLSTALVLKAHARRSRSLKCTMFLSRPSQPPLPSEELAQSSPYFKFKFILMDAAILDKRELSAVIEELHAKGMSFSLFPHPTGFVCSPPPPPPFALRIVARRDTVPPGRPARRSFLSHACNTEQGWYKYLSVEQCHYHSSIHSPQSLTI